MKTVFDLGNWNAICGKCGGKRKGTDVRLDGHWKGLVVCDECFDRLHPNERPIRISSKEGSSPRIVNIDPFPSSFENSNTVSTYSSGNQDSTADMFSGNNEQVGQTFTISKGATVDTVKFFIKKTNSPTGEAVAKLFNASSNIPTGAELGHTEYIDVTTFETSLTETEFTFTPPLNLSSGTYAILLEYTGGDSTDKLTIGYDGSSPTHEGQYFATNTADSSWSANSSNDVIFTVTGLLVADSSI